MAELVFLPRVLIARTEYGTAIYWDRRLGLLLRTEASPSLHAVAPDEIRRGYPAIWATWVRFASMFPQVALQPAPVGSGGRVA